MNFKMIASLVMAVGGFSLLTLTLCSSAPAKPRFDNSTVERVEMDKYLGEWYEIVRKPHSFEKGMTRVKATYTLLPDGRIDVRNEGMKNGKHKVAHGKARTTDTAGQLKVTFFIFPAEYNIMELAPDYSYSVVGGSNDGYLWILSRTPQMEPEVLAGIYERLEGRGYDLSDIVLVEQ